MTTSTSSSCPDPVYTVWAGENLDFETTTLRYGYTSLVSPPRRSTTTSRPGRPRWSSRRRCSAGTTPISTPRPGSGRPRPTAPRCPMSVVHRKDVPLDGTAPALLYGYGSYEILDRPDVLVRPAQPARPRLRLRDRPHPRWRRARPALVRGRQAPAQAQHVHRLRRVRRAPDRVGLHVARSARRAVGAPAAC